MKTCAQNISVGAPAWQSEDNSTRPCDPIRDNVVDRFYYCNKAAAYERGLKDRGRQAEVEASQLQDAAEKALEEVKRGAKTTIEEMVAQHAKELEAERMWVTGILRLRR